MSILKPKSIDDVLEAVRHLEDPNQAIKVAVTKLSTIDGVEKVIIEALEQGADPTKAPIDNVINPSIIKAILDNAKVKIPCTTLVYKGIKMGLIDSIINMINDGRIDPSNRNSIILVWATGFSADRLVKVLLKHPKVNPRNNIESVVESICVSIARGNTKILKMFLKDNRIDPSELNNRAIRMAAKFGNLGAVKLLLKDSRVDPSDRDPFTGNYNDALNSAYEEGHTDIVKFLLADPRVKSRVTDMSKYTKIVKEQWSLE